MLQTKPEDEHLVISKLFSLGYYTYNFECHFLFFERVLKDWPCILSLKFNSMSA